MCLIVKLLNHISWNDFSLNNLWLLYLLFIQAICHGPWVLLCDLAGVPRIQSLDHSSLVSFWGGVYLQQAALSYVVMSPSRAGWPPPAVKAVNSSSSMFLSCDTTHWMCWQSWWVPCSTCVTVVGPRGQRKLMQMSLNLWLLLLPWIIKSLLSGSLKSLTGTGNNKLIC